jgi:UDP-N-acetylmuramoylalanine--D-glutamate ligase
MEVRAGAAHVAADLDGATFVVTSPGLLEDADILVWARERGLPVWSEMELGARVCDVPYVAVTGTNGKTTVTGMIGSCLQASGIDAVACGNIGRPFPITATEDHDALVVECSSFQLRQQASLHPRVSVLLNLAPDHLDWHGGLAGYQEAKARIYHRQSGTDVHVGNRDDPAARITSQAAPCEIMWFGVGAPSGEGTGYDGDELVAIVDGEMLRLGTVPAIRSGYRANAAAAAAAALAFGATPEAIGRGLDGFVPAPHRGEIVVTVGPVTFIDDSKATNVHAALSAIDSVDAPVLIAGGTAKGVDLAALGSRADRLRGVVAIGEAAPEILRIFTDGPPTVAAGSIEEAVRVAASLARSEGAKTVLLAPACASWDQFRNYQERGERFAAAARAQADPGSAGTARSPGGVPVRG